MQIIFVKCVVYNLPITLFFRIMMAELENGTDHEVLDDTFQEETVEFDAGDATATSGITEDSGVEDPVSSEE